LIVGPFVNLGPKAITSIDGGKTPCIEMSFWTRDTVTRKVDPIHWLGFVDNYRVEGAFDLIYSGFPKAKDWIETIPAGLIVVAATT
jgi:hypothetical protein